MRCRQLSGFFAAGAMVSCLAARVHAEPTPDDAVINPPDEQQLTTGWDTNYAVLLGLQNIIASQGLFNGQRGFSLGAQMHLTEATAIRVRAALSRTQDPAYEEEASYKDEGGTVTTSKVMQGVAGPTSTLGIDACVDYVLLLSPRPIAPYAGIGIAVTLDRKATAYDDSVTAPGTRFSVDNAQTDLGMSIRGTAGVTWRVDQSLAFYLEYTPQLGLMRHTRFSNETKKRNPDNTSATGTKSGSQTRFVEMGIGIDQGAAVGIMAFF